ncbi:histone-lysine N-methyltransferase SETMAR [Trichonephila clavipes]|nr:histone-lysine N-methyltransferase SETMAR [Trichonephila clavipes]
MASRLSLTSVSHAFQTTACLERRDPILCCKRSYALKGRETTHEREARREGRGVTWALKRKARRITRENCERLLASDKNGGERNVILSDWEYPIRDSAWKTEVSSVQEFAELHLRNIILPDSGTRMDIELGAGQISVHSRNNFNNPFLTGVSVERGKNVILRVKQVAKIVNGVYGFDTVTANYVQFWFRRFRSGIFDVKDASRTGRHVVENVDKIAEIIKVDRHVSTRSIAQEIKIDHETVLNHLHKAGFKKKLDVWVLRQLTPKNMRDRISICEALAKRNEIDPFLKRIVLKKSLPYPYETDCRDYAAEIEERSSPGPTNQLRVFSGIGLELMTRPATIQYLDHSATAATKDPEKDIGHAGKPLPNGIAKIHPANLKTLTNLTCISPFTGLIFSTRTQTHDSLATNSQLQPLDCHGHWPHKYIL